MAQVSEAAVEQRFVDGIKRLGGRAFKFVLVPHIPGLPDRIAFLPMGVLILAEIKKPRGGVVSKVQRKMHGWFGRLGFHVHVLWTKEDVDALLQEVEGQQRAKAG